MKQAAGVMEFYNSIKYRLLLCRAQLTSHIIPNASFEYFTSFIRALESDINEWKEFNSFQLSTHNERTLSPTHATTLQKNPSEA